MVVINKLKILLVNEIDKKTEEGNFIFDNIPMFLLIAAAPEFILWDRNNQGNNPVMRWIINGAPSTSLSPPALKPRPKTIK